MIKLEFCELHGPLFLAGKNHGIKLFNKAGVVLEYDRGQKELYVYYNGKTAIIPSSNIASMTPADPSTKPQAEAPAQPPRGKVQAQVSSPMNHVFAEGPGKTRD